MSSEVKSSWIVVAVLNLLMLAPLVAVAQPGTVEAVEVQGLFNMSRDAFLHAFGIEVGQAYDEAQVRARFKHLWRLGLFEDITIAAETGPGGGKVLVVKVKERPKLSSVTYEDNSVATRTQIEDRFKERKVALKIGRPIDMGQVVFAEGAIRDLLAESGFLEAAVEAEVTKITETTRAVYFKINAGGKTRIKKIVVMGNEVFKTRKLKKQLKLTEERKWYWPWSQKNLYHPAKWDQDVTNVRDLYHNAGYLDVQIRPPVVEALEGKKARKAKKESGDPGTDQAEPATPPPGDEQPGDEEVPVASADEPDFDDEVSPKKAAKQRKREEKQLKKQRSAERKKSKTKRKVMLTVTINEGPQYTVGQVTIDGNEVFEDSLLRLLIPLKEGQILRDNLLEAGVQRITRLYENRGHLYATVLRRLKRHETDNLADIQIDISEDQPYYVARIEFSGNTSTHDRVLRRELFTTEGDRFHRDRVDASKVKVNQLGYFQVRNDPIIEPIEGENRVHITIAGEEQGRNEIQIGGGYSGLDGAFFSGIYSTRNFLGRGQVLSAALQIGGSSDRYRISFQEPWFLNRPIQAGFSIFRQDVDFGSSLRSTSQGAGIVLGRRLGRYSNFNVGYNYEQVSSNSVLASQTLPGEISTFSTENKISSLTPVFRFSSINNPYRPSRGRSFTASVQIAGGPLGGNTAYLKPVLSFTGYKRVLGGRYLALHAQVGQVADWQDGIEGISTSAVNEVPRFQRFWLGGDTLGPRVFETRTITPLRYVTLDENGQIESMLGDPRFLSVDDLVTSGLQPQLVEVGGDRFYLVQAELVVPLNEQADLAFFFDVGDSLFDDQSWGFDTTRAAAGVEIRFHLPIFPVPLRLIYGFPIREIEGDRTESFTFSIGRSF